MSDLEPRKFVIQSHRGYYQRVDDWGNIIWTTDEKKAWSDADFGVVSAEYQARGIRGAQIIDLTLFRRK